MTGSVRSRLLVVGLLGTAACHMVLGIDVDERSLGSPSPVVPATSDAGAPGPSRDAAMPVVTDSGGPRRCDPAAPFGTPEVVSELVSPTLDRAAARLSADERTLLFTESPIEGNYQPNLRTAVRAEPSGAFGPDGPLPLLDHPQSSESNASLTADGLTLYLDAFRDDTDAGIYRSTVISTRSSTTAPFAGRRIVPTLRSGLDGRTEVSDAYVVPDGSAIYVATFLSDLLWHVERAAVSDRGTTVGLLQRTGVDNAKFPVASPDELTLYFASARNRPAPADQFDLDIFVATRPTKTAPWGEARAVAEVNSDRQDVPSWISADGCVLYLASNRGRPGPYYAPRSIYRATRPSP